MSIETRSNSALFKRAEQLKNWEESETNRALATPREEKSRRIKFTSGCVFLAACAAGDKEEVLKLLENGAKIDTANVDGLTALHQACIDDNLDMVEFLIAHGADVNRGDNEGWTPLHATASCGFLSIAKYLLERGADPAAINNDGELPLDIAECQRMEDLLRQELECRGVDLEMARGEEERVMAKDAKEWQDRGGRGVDSRHEDTGATALHVAAAKGYAEVMKILFKCGADVDAQDVDGWTPLHAAAHWGQKEACQLLAENLADMDSKNFVGQTPFDLADTETFRLLEDLKKKQNKDEVNRRQAKKRIETQDRTNEAETPSKVIKVEISEPNEKNGSVEMEVSSESESESESSSETESNSTDDEKKNKVNSLHNNETAKEHPVRLPPAAPPKQVAENEENMPSWRRQYGRPVKPEPSSPSKTPGSFRDRSNSGELKSDNEVTLRRNNSFQNDKEFYTKYQALHARIKAYKDTGVNSNPINTVSQPRPQSDIILPSYKRSQQHYSSKDESTDTSSTTNSTPTSNSTSPVKPPSPVSNLQQNSQQIRRSFVPPVRDEESETQRKAHAKRVRETRRSTQGVTLEDIKSAEQLVKKTNQPTVTSTTPPANTNNTDQSGSNTGESSNGVSVTATITTGAPTVVTRESPDEQPVMQERRPSWRMRVDNGSCKFKLEDASKPNDPPLTPSYVRRTGQNNASRPSSAPVETAETTVTIPLRRPKPQEENDQDKENDVRNAQATLATQAAIQRRRRPKRRSTGVVALDDLDQDKDPAAGGDYDETLKLASDSGTEKSSRSQLGSSSDVRTENGEIDYKKLYEQAVSENERLKDKLKQKDEELSSTKQTLEKLSLVTSKNSLSELEKRERRAMERKLSEMEEELKQLEALREENEKLKGENGALIRVISKLSK